MITLACIVVAGRGVWARASYCQMRTNRRGPIPHALRVAFVGGLANVGLTRLRDVEDLALLSMEQTTQVEQSIISGFVVELATAGAAACGRNCVGTSMQVTQVSSR